MTAAQWSLLIASALAGCAAPDPPTLVGRYVRDRVSAVDDPDWRGVVGDWSAEYRADGILVVHGANGLDLQSRWQLDGDVLTLTDLAGSGVGSCRLAGVDFASGRYRVERRGAELRFHVLRDECGGRRSVLLSHPRRRAP